ncbi:restriction endonuclease subunit S, partial [Thiolapillus sp.]
MRSKSDKKKPLVPRLRFPEFREAGAWEVKRLGDVAALKNGYAFKSSKYSDNGAYKVVTIANVQAGHMSIEDMQRISPLPSDLQTHQKLSAGDILISMTGNVGRICYVLIDDCLLNQRVGKLVPTKIDKEFFYHSIQNGNFQTAMQERAKGGAQGNLSAKDILQHVIYYPNNKHEQQKIAHCLSSLDEVIGLQAKKVQALKQHKKGLMQQLFPAEGETTPRLRFPEFREAGAWEVKLLGGICNVLQGYGFPERLQGRQGGKYPFCKVSDITSAVNENGGHVVTAANYADEDIVAELRAKPIPVGATIFAKIGEALRLNKRAIVDVECLVDNNVAGLKAKTSAAVDYFIFLLSQNVDLNKHCGGAVPSVNKSTIEAIKVLAPEPPEQQKIAHCLSSLDEVIGLESHKLDALKNLKKGLMQQLFPQ